MAETLDSSHTASNALECITDRAPVKTQFYTDGAWVGAVDGATFPAYDPATNVRLVDAANFGHAETLRVIDAVNAAWSAWRESTGKKHAGLMRRWFDLLIADANDLTALMTAEQGKPLAEAEGEIVYGASFIEWFAEEVRCVSGGAMASIWRDKRMVVLKQPMGVCASIMPWNFSLAMIIRRVASAMAADYTIVIKSAEQTSFSTPAVAELAHRVDIPEGVVNVVTGDVDRSIVIGKALCESPIVRHLSFMGLMSVGCIPMQQCSPTVKKVALELGGHTPPIAFDDTDIDAAMESVVRSKYRNAGQTCVCTNRFYVHASAYDAFVEKLSTKARGIKVGNDFELGVVRGLLINDQVVEKAQRHIDDATQKGARLTAGGKLMQGFGSQCFVGPTVLADATSDMLIAREETFGPISTTFEFQDEAEVVRLANDTEFGSASYFFSRDIGRIWRVVERLEYGMVGINTGLISNEVVPSGGIKQSGLGREGSVYGINGYLELKYLCIGGT